MKKAEYDPWYKATFKSQALGIDLTLKVPHDVFSTQRIDEGTLLFLNHLPQSSPQTILDMGCGYGALGLPVAAKYSHARVEMVDRDLLAVKWALENARENKLENVHAFGSLGFRDLDKGARYDWILCNVPARIGRPFIKNFIEEGVSMLSDEGDLRMVVINDLATVLLEMKREFEWPLQEIVRGPRHSIFSITSKDVANGARFKTEMQNTTAEKMDALYLRDGVRVDPLVLKRPFDLGGDDQKRLQVSLPLLIDALPKSKSLNVKDRILVLKSGYGALPLVARARWTESKVVTLDRDLLGTTFTRLNAESLNLGGELLEIRECADLSEGIQKEECFSLVLGEISSSAGEAVALAELKAVESCLAQGAQALFVCHEKIANDWVKTFAAKSKCTVNRMLSRDGFSVIRISK